MNDTISLPTDGGFYNEVMSRYSVTLGREAKDNSADMDVASYDAARREAIRSLGEALRDDPSLLDNGRLRLDMVDEAGGLLFCVTLSTTELVSGESKPERPLRTR